MFGLLVCVVKLTVVLSVRVRRGSESDLSTDYASGSPEIINSTYMLASIYKMCGHYLVKCYHQSKQSSLTVLSNRQLLIFFTKINQYPEVDIITGEQ